MRLLEVLEGSAAAAPINAQLKRLRRQEPSNDICNEQTISTVEVVCTSIECVPSANEEEDET